MEEVMNYTGEKFDKAMKIMLRRQYRDTIEKNEESGKAKVDMKKFET